MTGERITLRFLKIWNRMPVLSIECCLRDWINGALSIVGEPDPLDEVNPMLNELRLALENEATPNNTGKLTLYTR